MVNKPHNKKESKTDKDQMERRNVNIDSDLVDKLKIIAIKEGVTLRQLCDQMAKGA